MQTLTRGRITGPLALFALLAGLLVVPTWAHAVAPIHDPIPSAGARAAQAATAQNTEGGATGDGPADDAECQDYADRIDVLVDVGTYFYSVGSPNTGKVLLDGAEELSDKAGDRGCFLIHEQAPQ